VDARFFTELDLKSGYYQICIAKGDEPNMACVMWYGSYEFSTNALATLYNLMNKVRAPFLDYFVVVYLGDIIYSKTLGEHMEHLWEVS